MVYNIRWRFPEVSPRVKVALMTFGMFAVTIAGSAAQRWH